ncbi:MAG: PASTA domain-containing protein [Bacteroidales bacterium]|nr:PASTA domain-containing protein [Bacteroidales bacterium]
MNFLRFLASKTFFKHLLIAILLTIGLALLVFKLLDNYTLHGQSISLPDFTGKTVDELGTYEDTYKFKFTVIDSVYNTKNSPGSILLQDPVPNSPVKKGRNVYLTVVAKLPEKIEMPDLRDLSLRQAASLLETYGLKSGKLTFVTDPDIESGNLIKYQIYDNDTLEPGTVVHKESTIDLIVGKSSDQTDVPVPLVTGMTLDQASLTLHKAALNVGSIRLLDQDEAEFYRVYRQAPEFTGSLSATIGSEVHLWLRSERNFNFESLVRRYQTTDTTGSQYTNDELLQMDSID